MEVVEELRMKSIHDMVVAGLHKAECESLIAFVVSNSVEVEQVRSRVLSLTTEELWSIEISLAVFLSASSLLRVANFSGAK